MNNTGLNPQCSTGQMWTQNSDNYYLDHLAMVAIIKRHLDHSKMVMVRIKRKVKNPETS